MISIMRRNCDDKFLGLYSKFVAGFLLCVEIATKTIYLKKKKKLGKINKNLFLSKKNKILFLKIGGMYWMNIIGYEVHYILENISQMEIL
jgi:hypothetical protein